MRQEHCRILAIGSVGAGHRLLQVDCTPLAQPARAGQFLMARPSADLADALRRPLFFSRGGHVAHLLFPLDELWQRELASLQPEETLDVLGPLGQPFSLRPGVNHVLVLALSEPVAPALAIAQCVQHQGATASVVLARKEWSPLADLLPDSIECSVAPADPLAQLQEALRWADQAFVVAPADQLAGLAAAVGHARLRLNPGFAQVLVPADFACGVGACGGCTLELGQRQRRVCADGPIFDLAEVV